MHLKRRTSPAAVAVVRTVIVAMVWVLAVCWKTTPAVV
jgi:hypothetical protein